MKKATLFCECKCLGCGNVEIIKNDEIDKKCSNGCSALFLTSKGYTMDQIKKAKSEQ